MPLDWLGKEAFARPSVKRRSHGLERKLHVLFNSAIPRDRWSFETWALMTGLIVQALHTCAHVSWSQ